MILADAGIWPWECVAGPNSLLGDSVLGTLGECAVSAWATCWASDQDAMGCRV